jgi:tRNA threonylcarbamoyladenosine biosynthesis protein TsaE
MTVEVRCPTVTDTRAAARRLASLCRPGDVILLCGPLGSGKTAFAGGLAEGLGVEETVSSPSFVLVRRYDSGFLPMVHADVYRLSSLAEFDDLEVFEEGREGVVVVEWGDAVAGAAPGDHLRVDFQVDEDGSRVLRLRPAGVWTVRPLAEVSA